MSPARIEGDRPCDYPGCDYVAVDDPELATAPAGRLANHKNKVHGPAADRPPPDPTVPQTDAEGTGPYGTEPIGPVTDEIPPGRASAAGSAGAAAPPRSGGLRDRFKRKPKWKEVPVKDGVPVTREKAPKSAGRRAARVSAAKDFADIWAFGGRQVLSAGHVPTGRMITFQAPIAGELLDDLVKGTAIDRLAVQRIVAGRAKWDQLFAIFGPPIFTLQMERAIASGSQTMLSTSEAMLKSCIRESLPVMVPAMRKARVREERNQQALLELLDTDDLSAFGIVVRDGKPYDEQGRLVDVADVFVGMLFAGWTAEPPPSESPIDTEAVAHE